MPRVTHEPDYVVNPFTGEVIEPPARETAVTLNENGNVLFEEDVMPAEPSLANTETGFKLGVEAACALIAKNVRLRVKMTNGKTMGEDIAARITKDLLG